MSSDLEALAVSLLVGKVSHSLSSLVRMAAFIKPEPGHVQSLWSITQTIRTDSSRSVRVADEKLVRD